MRITKTRLKEIILEEIKETLTDKEKRDRERELISKQRKDSMIGKDALRLARGITEHPKDEEHKDNSDPKQVIKKLDSERLDLLYKHGQLQIQMKELAKQNETLKQQLKAAASQIEQLSNRRQLDVDRCLNFVSNVQDAVKGKKTADKK
tara:strand:- start:33 stop:479 length:447 start_codon:yes stop_codon:yes gene_type:complete